MSRRVACCGLVVAASLLPLGARHLGAGEVPTPAPDGLVRMTVSDVSVDPDTHAPLVVLTTARRDRALVILIGHAEAIAILQRLRGAPAPPRPMTHDLLATVLSRLGGKLNRIAVTRLARGTFHAELVVRRGEQMLRIDSRPSDAMALALRAGAPIFVARAVLNEAGIRPHELPPRQPPSPPRRPTVDPERTL